MSLEHMQDAPAGASRFTPPESPDARTWGRRVAPLEVRAPLAVEAAPPASVAFRVSAVLGMALGLALAVLRALDASPPTAAPVALERGDSHSSTSANALKVFPP